MASLLGYFHHRLRKTLCFNSYFLPLAQSINELLEFLSPKWHFTRPGPKPKALLVSPEGEVVCDISDVTHTSVSLGWKGKESVCVSFTRCNVASL